MSERLNHDHIDRRRALAAAAAAVAAYCLGGRVAAQSAYPDRALRIIVPQPPGGGFDFVSRVLAERLAKQLGQAVVVENRPGSGTLVGTDLAAKAAPDGYTLLTGSISNLALNMGLYRNLPYDSLRDFEPIGLAVSYSHTLMARKDLAQTTLAELVAFARANPGKLTYASAGNGSGQHVLAAALWHLAGAPLAHIPYRGAQAAYQDLLGGRVDVFFDLSPTARVQIDAGSVRPLAVSGAERLAQHPQVPTIVETGSRSSNSNPGSACSRRPARRPPYSNACAPRPRASPPRPRWPTSFARPAASRSPCPMAPPARWCSAISNAGRACCANST